MIGAISLVGFSVREDGSTLIAAQHLIAFGEVVSQSFREANTAPQAAHLTLPYVRSLNVTISPPLSSPPNSSSSSASL
jgi:hypothetical protein